MRLHVGGLISFGRVAVQAYLFHCVYWYSWSRFHDCMRHINCLHFVVTYYCMFSIAGIFQFGCIFHSNVCVVH